MVVTGFTVSSIAERRLFSTFPASATLYHNVIFHGTSSGTAPGPEPWDVRPLTARNVRVTGHGNRSCSRCSFSKGSNQDLRPAQTVDDAISR